MAQPDVGIRIHGLKQLNRAFSKAEKDARTNVRLALRAIAEPIKSEAEQRASAFTNIGQRWSRMRIGVLRSVVYVAPMTRSRNPTLRRPNLAHKLMDESMDPALESHRFGLEVAVGKALDQMADDWARNP
jgi:hypothetical protein